MAGPPFSCSLGWLRRHASCRSSELRFLSSRQRSLASSVFFLFLRSRLRSPRRSVLLLAVESSDDLPIILSLQPPASQQQNRKARPAKGDRNMQTKRARAFGRYYASTQSRARTPEERSVVTWRTASSSPERSRHRRTRSSPKFLLRWLAA